LVPVTAVLARWFNPEAGIDLPDKPPSMCWSRYNQLAERASKQRVDDSDDASTRYVSAAPAAPGGRQI